jgi:hypothetical protein
MNFYMPHRSLAVALALSLVGTLFWVPAALFWFGISPSGVVEESVGYRYFYSLRLAFGGEHSFLPQGHFPTLVHVLIQRLLSAVHPVDQLFPRIDTFSLVAVATPAVLGAVAAYFALRRFPRPGMIITAACALLLLASSQLPGFIGWTTMPDYHVWVIPLAFLCLALTLIDGLMTPRQAAMLGLVAGLALGVKITFFVFPLVPIATRLPLDRRALLLLFIFGMTAGLVYLATLALFAGVELTAFARLLRQLYYFTRGQSNNLPADGWAQIMGYDLLAICLLPPTLIALGVLLRERAAFAAALALILSLLFLSRRPYSHSLVEVHALGTLAIGIGVAVIARHTGRLRHALTPMAVAAVALLLAFGPERVNTGVYTTRGAQAYNEAAAQWRSKLDLPMWIATTGNDYRPHSVESAICKGGRELLAPDVISPYVTSLFPHFRCALTKNELTDIENSSVGFVRLPTETLAESKKRLEDFFSVSLATHHCQEIASPSQFLVYCLPTDRSASVER